MKKTWTEIEKQAWDELADQGDLGEVRFNQRVRTLAEQAGFSSEDIQRNFKEAKARIEFAASRGYTAQHPWEHD